MKIIEELEAALAAATPGEWEVGHLDKAGQRVIQNEHIEIATLWHHSVGSIEKEMEANARLITLMHNHLPALIEAVKVLDSMRRDTGLVHLMRHDQVERMTTTLENLK